MKKIILLSAIVLFHAGINAQSCFFARQLGGTSNDYVQSMAIDSSENIYLAGYFSGTADFDPGAGTYNLTSVGGEDIFVCKLDPSGNFVWAKQMGGTGNDECYSIAVDGNGNVFTTGIFRNTADFDPSASTYNFTSAGLADIFISKLDASGNFVWAKQIGGTSMDDGNSIALDGSGNVYTTGDFIGTVDFDPGVGVFNQTSTTGGYIYVSKLDSAGNFVWAKQMGGTSVDAGRCITVDGSGNVYTGGYFSGTADFDPSVGTFTLTSAGGYDIFISKLNSSGNFVWAKQMGGTGFDYVWDIAVDGSGNVYSSGNFQSTTADFDPGAGTYNLTSFGSADAFVSKLNSSGNFVWAKQMGGTGTDGSFSIALDGSSNVYTAGYFSGTADFDPGAGTYNMTPTSSTNIYTSKLTSAGNFVWAKQMWGSGGGQNRQLIAVDANLNIYTAGGFFGTGDFDPGAGIYNLTSYGVTDAFVSKLYSLTLTTSTTPASCAPGNDGTATVLESGGVSPYSYSWNTLPIQTTATATNLSLGIHTVTVADNNGCSATASITTILSPIPATPGIVSGNTIVCNGSSNTYSITAVTYATSYTWTLPSGWTGSSTTNSINTTASVTGGNITVIANNSCGSSSPRTLNITVINATPVTPGSISGSTTICSGSTNIYSITAVAGATSYSWTLPSGWIGSSITTSINTTASSTSGNVTVTANNSCGSSSVQTLSVNVDTIPATPTTIIGTTPICSGSSNTYSIAPVSGASSYTWTLPSGWIGSSTTTSINTIANATSGNISVTANNFCGSSASQTIIISVTTADTSVSVSGATLTANATLSVYQWLNCIGNTPISGQTNQNFTATANGNYAVIVTQNGCSDTSSCYSINNIGIKENSFSTGITIYPNPSNGKFTLELENINGKTKDGVIEIYNVIGEKVYYSAVQQLNFTTIDLSDKPSGIYFLTIHSNNEKKIIKVIKL
jgi:hypothetical protein